MVEISIKVNYKNDKLKQLREAAGLILSPLFFQAHKIRVI